LDHHLALLSFPTRRSSDLNKAVLGLDPGIRTGVKAAVIDATGKVLDTATVYPFEPRRDREGAIRTLAGLATRYQVELVAIGNGTDRKSTRLNSSHVKTSYA